MFLSPPLKHDLRISGHAADRHPGVAEQDAVEPERVPRRLRRRRAPRRLRTSGDGVQNLTTRSCWGDCDRRPTDACYLDVDRADDHAGTIVAGREGHARLVEPRLAVHRLRHAGDDRAEVRVQVADAAERLHVRRRPPDRDRARRELLRLRLGQRHDPDGDHGRHEAEQGHPARRRRLRGGARLGCVRRPPGGEDRHAARGRGLPPRQAGDRELPLHRRAGRDRLLRRHGPERRADRHLDARAAHVHGHRDRRRRQHGDGDDALHGRLHLERLLRADRERRRLVAQPRARGRPDQARVRPRRRPRAERARAGLPDLGAGHLPELDAALGSRCGRRHADRPRVRGLVVATTATAGRPTRRGRAPAASSASS